MAIHAAIWFFSFFDELFENMPIGMIWLEQGHNMEKGGGNMTQNKTVLVVDCDIEQAKALRPILQENGYHMIAAYEENAAMKLLQNNTIQLIQNSSNLLEMETTEVIKDSLGILSIDLNRRLVEKDGEEIRLTPTEYKILTMMAKSPNRVFTREQLITYALEDEFHGYDRSIDTYIKGLRKKIETDRSNPRYIHTVHGFGYKFVP